MRILNKRIAQVSLAILLITGSWSCAPDVSEEHQPPTPIFREITLHEGVTVALGQDISELKEVCAKNEEGYHLLPIAFSKERADSISIYVTEDNKIHTIHTYYDQGESVEEKVQPYNNYFNTDYTTIELERDFKNLKILFWQDGETVFGLVEGTKKGKPVFYSFLCDRKLYKEDFSSLTNSILNDSSIDLSTSIEIMKSFLKN